MRRLFSGTAIAALSLSAAMTPMPAQADPPTLPSLVEDGAYPGAAAIVADQNVRLLNGDGHIVLADCTTPPVGDIGLLKVYTTDETIGADGIGRVCFKVGAATGWLTLQVPGVYEIRGDGQRTGTGHEVTAELESEAGEQITVDVDPDGSTQVGIGADPNASPTMLLALRTGSGIASVTGSRAGVGRIDFGGRGCTATLIRPTWVLTAASCLSENPDEPVSAAGEPARITRIAFPGQAAVEVNRVVPRGDRDLAIARLAVPMVGVSTMPLGTNAPASGTSLYAVGYGRTPTAWNPDTQHQAELSLTAVSVSAVSATAAVGQLCKGDAGGPAFDGAGRILAVHSRGGQAGCLDSSGSDSATVEARVDDLGAWIAANAISNVLVRNEVLSANQFIRSDGNGHELVMQTDGNLVLHQAGTVMWAAQTWSQPGAYAVLQTDGNLVVYSATAQPLWDTGTSGTAADRLVLQPDGNLVLYGPNGQAYWASDDAPRSFLPRNKVLTANHVLRSDSGGYELIMQVDGNLVLKHDGVSIWDTGTWAHPGAYAVLQSDGNFVVYSASDQPLWDTGTDGTAGDRLVVQPDGNVVLYGNAQPIWDRF